MTDERNRPAGADRRGHQPSGQVINNGYQPSAARPGGLGPVTGGHQPTTSQGAPANPPNQGSSGKK